MICTTRLLCLFLVLEFWTRAALGQTCCLPGDTNGDLSVTASDVPLLVSALLGSGPPPQALCAADVNRDGVIDGGDVQTFVQIRQSPSMGLFDYGPARSNAEAEQIALEMLGAGGPLLPSDAMYDRIVRDLALIRVFEPRLASQSHTAAWGPNQLIVKVWQGQPRTQYNCLNAYYRMTSQQFLFSSGGGDWYTLTFAGHLNVARLALIYAATPEVDIGEPNGIIGGENFWTASDRGGGVWHWHVDDGFTDCFDGCDCHMVYDFDVDSAGHVTLTGFQQYGQPWCVFP